MTQICSECGQPRARVATLGNGHVICEDCFYALRDTGTPSRADAAAVVMSPSLVPVKTGRFPYRSYVASCSCRNGAPIDMPNYIGHPIGPPKCSVCKASYVLDISLMSAGIV